MGDKEVKECIDTIKMLFPADDTSHFTIGGKDDENNEGDNAADSLDSLWDRWDDLEEQGLDDKSDEGAELRADIKTFIEDNDLDVQVKRGKSNHDLLTEIEEAMNGGSNEEEEEEEEKPAPKKLERRREPEPEPEPEEEEEDDDDDTEPAAPSVPEDEEEEEPARPVRSRHERNDDTNEPAARPERRAIRPHRHR